MLKKWNSLGAQGKLHILIQGTLILLLLISQEWVISRFEAQILADSKSRAMELADGLLNGMNMLMLTGQIGNPANRELLLKKMADAPGVKELRIVRARQVQDQFGRGLDSEQARDLVDKKALDSGKPVSVKTRAADGTLTLRVVVPFIARHNFRGTNCMQCHQVKEGSVNGAASITMDLSDDESRLDTIKKWLWGGHFAFQIVLSLLIAWFVRVVIVRNIAEPVKKLQTTMSEIERDGDLSRRAEFTGDHSDIAEMAQTFNSFVENLQLATERLDLFAKVFENSGEAITITDSNNNIVTVNRAFTQITGYLPDEVIGKNPRIMSSGRQDKAFYQAMWGSIQETGHWQGEIWNRRKSGEVYPEWISISAVKNSQGRVVNYISIFNDITKRKEVDERIKFLAHFDPLTELPNRALFADRLNQALAAAKRSDRKVALLFLDLDRFKSINDSLGHFSGDALLQSVARRLKGCIRESDSICRQGGDEFMIMLNGIEKADDVAHIATKIIEEMAEPHYIGDRNLIISFSIGISLYPDDALDAGTLIKNADAAMYHAKDSGRNNFQFFTPDMNAEALDRLSLESDLRHALKRGEFLLHYQPQLDVAAGKIVGMEALVRWQHPTRGLIPPVKFISIAEECGLIVSIGEWVLETACRQNKAWQEAGLVTVPIAVNISALQFHQKDLKQTISRILAETGLEPRYLELELTEGIVMQKADATILLLNDLKQMGVLLSIDDFGTGYSSLSYLKRFPIDKLKIDRSFVRDITINQDDATITHAIISMGHSLRLKVIAEGVETGDQLDHLKQRGCDEIQGFLLSRPLMAEDLEALLKTRSEN